MIELKQRSIVLKSHITSPHLVAESLLRFVLNLLPLAKLHFNTDMSSIAPDGTELQEKSRQFVITL